MSHFTDKYFLKLSPLPRSVFCGCGTVQPSMWQALALCWGPGMPNPHLLEKDTAGNNKGLTRLLQQTLSPALYKSSISKLVLSPFPHAGQLHSCELWLQWQKTHMLLITSWTLSCTWNRHLLIKTVLYYWGTRIFWKPSTRNYFLFASETEFSTSALPLWKCWSQTWAASFGLALPLQICQHFDCTGQQNQTTKSYQHQPK